MVHHSANLSVLGALLAVWLCVCGRGHVVSAISIRSWLTQADPQTGAALSVLEEQSPISSASETTTSSADVKYVIDASTRLQSLLGYGAGLPQASAKVLTDLKRRNTELYQYVLNQLFGVQDNGAGINVLRFPIGSCDFSMTNTSYDEYSNDYSLQHFAIDNDSQLILEVLKDTMNINPNMKFIASPWSAPSWLKTEGSLIAYNENNTLLSTERAYDTYANYFVSVLNAFADSGVQIHYFTLQNEPLFGTSDQYPGMYFTAEQAIKLGDLLRTKLGDKVKLLAYDHNWDVPQYPLQELQATSSANVFYGTAWHCYAGDMATALDMLHSAFPSLPQFITECTGAYPNDVCDITQGMTDFGWNHEWDMSNILLGAASHWSSSGVKWILALDENCGPTLPDVTFKSGRPLVSVPTYANSESDIYFNQDYFSIKHMSKYLMTNIDNTESSPRSKDRINHADSTRLSSTSRVLTTLTYGNSSQLIVESFENDDSNSLIVIAMNMNHESSVNISFSQDSVAFSDDIPPFATKIYVWPIA